MKKSSHPATLADVQAVYSGPEGTLWEKVMGEQIHIGGLTSSINLAERAGIAPNTSGVDLCCCSGAGMRFLLRFRGVGFMTGVDATEAQVALGQRRMAEEGFCKKSRFVLGDASATGLPDAQFDFAWGEDAWCYVVDKPALIAEAVRIVRPGGTVAFTDWVEGPTPMTPAEADRFMGFMKFPNMQDLGGYRILLEKNGCIVEQAAATGRFAPCVDLYINLLTHQQAYDALKIIGFDQATMQAIAGEMAFIQSLAHAGKVVQGLFVARKP